MKTPVHFPFFALISVMRFTLTSSLCVACCLATLVFASDARADYHALLIGVGEYENQDLAPLEFATNDVDRLAQALIDRGEYREANVWKSTDASRPGREPTRKNLLPLIKKFLSSLAEGDTALVYFSGHGVQDANGQLYLAPRDYDPDNQASTGLPADWLRQQLAACPAETKLLVLDSCYAGTKGRFAGAGAMQEAFANLGGVVTLASSSGAEKSIVDAGLGQSLFGYWLTKALTGHADANMDAKVSFSEAYEFVRQGVEQNARRQHGASQTPRQHIGLDVDGMPTLTELAPQPIATVLDDMAEQIALLARSEGFELVGSLPEFSTRAWDDNRLRDVLSDEYGSLGRRLAEDLRERIDMRFASTGVKSQQVEPRLVLKALRDQRLTPDQITTVKSPFGAELKGKDCVILNGQIRVRENDMLLLQTTVIQNGRDAHTVGGRARLSLDDWSELGYSVAMKASDYRRSRDPETGALKSAESSAIERLDLRLEEQIDTKTLLHPLQQPDFAFEVKVLARGSKDEPFEWRRPVFRDGKAYVGLDEGENYVIDIHYDNLQGVGRGDNVYAKILVDGVSILGTQFYSPGDYLPGESFADGPSAPGGDRPVFKEAAYKGIDLIRVAQPSALSRAQEWVLPKSRSSVRYEGFYPQGDGDVARFLVCDAAESIGADRAYGQSVGMITVAFYDEVGSPRGGDVGTKPGEVLQGRTVKRVKRTGYPGRQLAVVHLNYLSRDAVAKLAAE